MLLFEEVEEARLRQVEFHLVERFERLAKVNQHEVALVAELRVERAAHGRAGIGPFHCAEGGRRFGGYLGACV